jgi:type III secretion protein L
MAFILQRNQTLSRLNKKTKIIKAKDFWAYKTAAEAVADGNAERERIIAAARAAFEAEKIRGYREGKESAQLEQTSNMISIISQTVDYFAKVEVQMVDLVMDAVRRIVSEFDEREKVVKVVRNALALVRSQKQITVKVHPSQIEVTREHVDGMLHSYPGIEQIEVIGDLHLAEDACIIESDIGQVEASMSGQLEALRATFSRVFSSIRESPPDAIGADNVAGTKPESPVLTAH